MLRLKKQQQQQKKKKNEIRNVVSAIPCRIAIIGLCLVSRWHVCFFGFEGKQIVIIVLYRVTEFYSIYDICI